MKPKNKQQSLQLSSSLVCVCVHMCACVFWAPLRLAFRYLGLCETLHVSDSLNCFSALAATTISTTRRQHLNFPPQPSEHPFNYPCRFFPLSSAPPFSCLQINFISLKPAAYQYLIASHSVIHAWYYQGDRPSLLTTREGLEAPDYIPNIKHRI